MICQHNLESPRDVLKEQLIEKLSKVYLSFDSSKFVIWGTGAYGKWYCHS